MIRQQIGVLVPSMRGTEFSGKSVFVVFFLMKDVLTEFWGVSFAERAHP